MGPRSLPVVEPSLQTNLETEDELIGMNKRVKNCPKLDEQSSAMDHDFVLVRLFSPPPAS